ncbi:FAD-dependent monooxygenase [Streptomyces sp. NPDC021093]|uniref:oxidoreductase n=1 Tax=Streptomyces sp. NPDC021093 TaxID=3365112 RepID=UPI003789D0AB
MRIAVIGGGPGGLYFGVLARRLGFADEVTVWERHEPDETFGFGVVLSDRALDGIERADAALVAELRPILARWDDIEVHCAGSTFTAGGNRFTAVSRTGLLTALQRRCARLGVLVRHGGEITDAQALAADHDVVVAADGVNSLTRQRLAAAFRPSVRTGACRYIWLGSNMELDSFKFYVVDTPGGALLVHAYPDSDHSSTLVLEMSETAWHAAGFADVAPAQLAPGEGDERSIEIISELCKDILGGHKLHGNNSRWLRFPTVHCQSWRHRNIVLIGDAAHTAHFSIGSGTQLAMDDASALAQCLHAHPDTEAALAAYEAERRPAVLSLQRAARASQEWFENVDRYTRQAPQQFAVNLLTRSRRVSYAGLRRRAPEFVGRAERWFAEAADGRAGPPMLQPFTLAGVDLVNRVVAAPGEVFSTRRGAPDDFHLVHLGGAALGGAGLVLTGPLSVSATGTAAPAGAGLYTGEQEAGWRRVVDFVHAHSPAKVGAQLGHFGPDGSAPPPGELRRAFTAAARRAVDGFDLLELDCAHGGLLSSLLSPAADGRGGEGRSLRERLAYPLEVFGAIREVWPAERPISLRISPARWYPDGEGADEVAEIADEFAARGATALHVCADSQSDADRYADRIRNRSGHDNGLAVIAAGPISAADVNTIVLAGRADLCVVDGSPVNWPWHAADGTSPRSATHDQP